MSNPKDDASFIPASQRPDGTWRKARRVKEGYVPQEEVPLYESKGKKFMNKSATPANPACVNGYTSHRTIPGLYIPDPPAGAAKEGKVKKKEKKAAAASVADVTANMQNLTVNGGTNRKCDAVADAAVDPAKKLKNLRKRLREVEALEEKIRTGKVVKPEPEQLAKVARKVELILQISQLESSME